IAVDARGSAYVVGSANSRNFPTTPDSLRPTGGSSDAFVSKLALNADLALGLSDLPDPLQSGGAVSYLITVTNNGPDVAEGVRLGYTLPAGTEVSRATTQGDCAAATCDLGSLAVGGRATVTIVFKPNQTGPGSFRATATASATTPDLNLNNNSAEQETRFSTLPSIYGRVTTADGAGLGNVAVALGGAQRPGATTSGDGIYQFAELPVGAGYNLTPSRAGYVFNPPSRAIDNLQTDQRADFSAVACRFTIGPTTLSLPSTGGTATVAITSPDSQCEWTARSNLPWIKFNNAAADGTVTGRGNGSVTLTVAPTVGSRSGALTIAGATLTVRQEFNACSRPEFINPPVFWVNNLAGDFGQPSLIVRDINGDGIDDVFLLTRKDNLSGVSVMIGKAGGGFEAPVMLLSEVESETQKINSFHLKDVNADGKPDLIAVYRASNGRVIVAFGDGRGVFGAPASYAAGQFPGDAAIADFNSDGKPDIALLGFNNNPPLSILLNNGDGTFGAAAPVNTSGMLSTSGFRIGVSDFNQDGKADLAILIESSAFVGLLGDGPGRSTPQTPISAIFTSQSFAIGDFNGDGKSDVVIAGDGIQFLAGRGDGSFDTPVIYPYGNSRTFIVAEDFT